MTAQGPEDLRAVHAARRELGPDYDDALLDSFVDRAEIQLRQRLEAQQIGGEQAVERRAPREVRQPVSVTLGPGGLTLLLVNGLWGVLSTVILTRDNYDNLAYLMFVWMVFAVAGAAYLGARIAGRKDASRKRVLPVDVPSRRPASRRRPGRSSTT